EVQTDQVTVVLVEQGEPSEYRYAGPPRQPGQQAVKLEKGEVPVPGYGPEDLARRDVELGPPPLVLVAVPVADEHVEEACPGECTFVHPLVVVFGQVLKQLARADVVIGVTETSLVGLILTGSQLEECKHVGKLAAVPTEPRGIGYDNEGGLCVVDAGSPCEVGKHKGAIRVHGRCMV